MTNSCIGTLCLRSIPSYCTCWHSVTQVVVIITLINHSDSHRISIVISIWIHGLMVVLEVLTSMRCWRGNITLWNRNKRCQIIDLRGYRGYHFRLFLSYSFPSSYRTLMTLLQLLWLIKFLVPNLSSCSGGS